MLSDLMLQALNDIEDEIIIDAAEKLKKKTVQNRRKLNDLKMSVELFDHRMVYKGLEMFPNKHLCSLNGNRLALTQTELLILQTLMENCGRVVNVKELTDHVWGDAVYVSRNGSIAVHIRHLREKMQDTQKPFCYVKNVWGVGYILG